MYSFGFSVNVLQLPQLLWDFLIGKFFLPNIFKIVDTGWKFILATYEWRRKKNKNWQPASYLILFSWWQVHIANYQWLTCFSTTSGKSLMERIRSTAHGSWDIVAFVAHISHWHWLYCGPLLNFLYCGPLLNYCYLQPICSLVVTGTPAKLYDTST